MRAKLPKLAALLDEAEVDVLAFLNLPKEHRDKIGTTYPIERVNGEIKQRTDVVGIFPTKTLLSASSALSRRSKTTNGPSSAPEIRDWKPSLR